MNEDANPCICLSGAYFARYPPNGKLARTLQNMLASQLIQAAQMICSWGAKGDWHY